MDNKSFVEKLNQIITALIAMTPAQRVLVHLSIQTTQVEISINELFQPMFDNLSKCLHWQSSHFNKWGKAVETHRYYRKELQTRS